MKINYQIIFYFFGILLMFNDSKFSSSILSFIYNDGVTYSLIVSGIIVKLFDIFLQYIIEILIKI